jgi:BA14K-like protein
MRKLLVGSAVAAALLMSVPAFAQDYGPGPGYGSGYGSGPGPGYAPAPDTGYAPAPPEQGYGQGYDQGYSGPTAPGPMYEGRSVAVGPADPTDNNVAWCQAHFRSYNPSTGMYLGYDGQQHPCP